MCLFVKHILIILGIPIQMAVAHVVQTAKTMYVPLIEHVSTVLIRSMDHIANGFVAPLAKILSVTRMAAAFHVKMNTTLDLYVARVVKMVYQNVIHAMDWIMIQLYVPSAGMDGLLMEINALFVATIASPVIIQSVIHPMARAREPVK